MDSVFQQNSAEIASETFDDGLVSINFLTGRYFTMNRTGELVWACLAEGSTAKEIADWLASAGGVGRDVVLADVTAFLETLSSERMIVARPGNGSSTSNGFRRMPQITEALVYETPHLQIYEDLADLILLDPIHDVNEALGWPVSRGDVVR